MAMEQALGRYVVNNEQWRPIAESLVEKHEIISHVEPEDIVFIENHWLVPKPGQHIVLATITKLPERLQVLCGYSYVLELRMNAIGYMTQKQLNLLIYHELRHIDRDGTVRKHDIEDFREIVNNFGLGWANPGAEIKDILEINCMAEANPEIGD